MQKAGFMTTRLIFESGHACYCTRKVSLEAEDVLNQNLSAHKRWKNDFPEDEKLQNTYSVKVLTHLKPSPFCIGKR